MKPSTPTLDSLSTIHADGSRQFVHPSDVHGSFTRWRRIAALALLVIYIALPWIPVNGFPAVFLDVQERRFHFFGLTLATQDLWIGFFLVTGLAFSLFFVTSLFGRVWCGWTCPYTVFMEQIYRRVERWIDGDGAAQRRLEDAPWTAPKIARRVFKHGVFVLISAIIAHIFLSYFVSIRALYEMMQHSPAHHAKAFGVVLFLTGALYFSFSWFREQFCIILCPYGRLQSALTDDDSIVIGYDKKRGEPRGKTTVEKPAGDCIDCRRCVQVCPTGIDIRNGLQMECIGCAACIDACDDIMRKVNRPTGLVRYDSTKGLAGEKRRILRPRIWLYAGMGMIGFLALGFTAFHKAKPVFAEVSRMRGAPFYVDPTVVRNHYQLRLLNKRNQPVTFEVSLEDAPEGFTLSGIGESLTLNAHAEASRPMIIINDLAQYSGPTELTLKIKAQPGDATITQKIKFLGPNPNQLNNK